MKRRHWLLGGAGAAAALAGVAYRQWHEQPVAGAAAIATSGAATDPPWNARFDTPDGGLLVLATLRGAPLLLNFWATWCPPCVKEMPELDRFAREQSARGIRVVGLAIDSPTPVRKFLAVTPVSYPIGLAGFEGTDLSRALGNSGGSLPFTVLLGRDGQVLQRKLGETTVNELTAWVARL